MTDRTITLPAREAGRLIEGGYIQRILKDGVVGRITHAAYRRPFPVPADRHISLSAAEADIIARMPEGLIIGKTTIRSEAAS